SQIDRQDRRQHDREVLDEGLVYRPPHGTGLHVVHDRQQRGAGDDRGEHEDDWEQSPNHIPRAWTTAKIVPVPPCTPKIARGKPMIPSIFSNRWHLGILRIIRRWMRSAMTSSAMSSAMYMM